MRQGDVDGKPLFHRASRTARMGADGSRLPLDLRVVGSIPTRLTSLRATSDYTGLPRCATAGQASRRSISLSESQAHQGQMAASSPLGNTDLPQEPTAGCANQVSRHGLPDGQDGDILREDIGDCPSGRRTAPRRAGQAHQPSSATAEVSEYLTVCLQPHRKPTAPSLLAYLILDENNLDGSWGLMSRLGMQPVLKERLGKEGQMKKVVLGVMLLIAASPGHLPRRLSLTTPAGALAIPGVGSWAATVNYVQG